MSMESPYSVAAPSAELSFREMHVSRAGKDGIEVVVLDALASLKLTVALFVFGIFVVLVGTLAQVEMDIWEVVSRYFHTWVMWVDVRLFFPPSFFPDLTPTEDLFVNGFHFPKSLAEAWNYIWYHAGFPAPGGWCVGVLMSVNLLTAHFWRFKLQAKGNRLWAGLAVIAVGCLFLAAVVAGGNGNSTDQARPFLEPEQIWLLFRVLLGIAWLAVSVRFAQEIIRSLSPISAEASKSPLVSKRILTLAISVYLGLSTLVVLLLVNYLAPQPEATRILWQILIALFGSAILYFGCHLVFIKRAGIVLLHAGIGLLMANELLVNRYAVEWQISLQEGQSANYMRDIRTTELAIIAPGADGQDTVTAIPRKLVEQNYAANKLLAKEGKELLPISSPVLESLPFHVSVVEYYKNAELSLVSTKNEKNLATAGTAFENQEIALPLKPMTGTDTKQGVDMAAAYIRLTDKKSGKDLGTYLVPQLSAEQDSPERYAEKVEVDGKTYELYLRFARAYRDFEVELVDVRKDDYLGTNTVKNYSSDILVSRKELAKPASFKIRMNDPLRYDNLTFYQSGYFKMPSGPEVTTLAVVSNKGWMIPYVACMIIAVGMLGHFMQMLLAFLMKVGREEQNVKSTATAKTSVPGKRDVYSVVGTAKAPAAQNLSAVGGRASTFMAGGGWLWPSALGISLALFIVVAQVRPIRSTTQMVNKNWGGQEFAPSLSKFSKVVVLSNGRAMPIDTLARNTLRAISGREVPNFQVLELVDGKPVKDEHGDYKVILDKSSIFPMKWKAEPAEWLLHSVTQSEMSLYIRQFKIDSPEVAKMFKPRTNPGGMYSIYELRDGLAAFAERAEQVREKAKVSKGSLTPEERKISEVSEKLAAFNMLVEAFVPPPVPPLPTSEEFEKNPEASKLAVQEFAAAVGQLRQRFESREIALSIPMDPDQEQDTVRKNAKNKEWESYPEAWIGALINSRLQGKDPDATVLAWEKLKLAFDQQKPAEFATAVGELSNRQETIIRKLNLKKTAGATDYIALNKIPLEARFNSVSPFYLGVVLYTICLMAAPLAWLVRSRALGKSIFVMLLFTLLIHTLALAVRIYISGRPPVTNLYSSAVFIAWAGVVLGLGLEMVYRIGIGNMIAAISGFGGLLIAYFLAAGGDTIGVLQAVLDTQFWLATHVVLITLGYAATFVAGFLGVLFVLGGVLTRNLDDIDRKDLGRMMYGATCFAIFCSFIGTILGGLWADDSWGRFWGWDPKENGALIIVLWNAVLLHARWDKMVAERGLAVLAIFGNIVTAWSWFGVNELGIGLHSYGFTQGVLLALGVGVLAHLALIGLGLLPFRLWLSYQAKEAPTEVVRA